MFLIITNPLLFCLRWRNPGVK